MKFDVKQRNLFIAMFVAAMVLVAAGGFLAGRNAIDFSDLPVVDSSIFTHSEIADYESALPPAPKDMGGWRDLNVPNNVPKPVPEKFTVVVREKFGPPKPEIKKEEPKPVVKEPVKEPVKEVEKFIRHGGQPAKIVIIIDDMGMDKKHTKQATDLPGPLTLAWLPYASGLDEMTARAKHKGHELIIHVPMEAMDGKLNIGPLGLKEKQSAEEFDAALEKIFASFRGYVGINNHMGSRLTKNEKAMNRVMAALKKRGLLFVDSKTIGSSVAGRVAGEYGLAHADRDIFLDHQDTPEFVRKALRQVEQVAHRRGYAVAIGHPKEATIQALREWLPGLKARGFELVPVSAVVRKSIEVAKPSSVIPVAEPAGPPVPQPSGPPGPY